MKRRNFVRNTILGTTASSLFSFREADLNFINIPQKYAYPLNFAPHEGMFRHLAGESVLDQIRFMADQGFTAFEDNEMRNRPIEQQQAIGKLLTEKNMTMGVFVAHKIYWSEPNLASGARQKRDEFLEDIRNSVEVAKRCNARWMTVVPGYRDQRLSTDYQTANVIESLKQACEILEEHQLVMVLEPLNFRDHPGMFLTGSPQTYLICKAVDSPACKILFDIYHQQIQEGNLIPNIEASWDEIAYFQLGDNPGRKEPTTGEINFKNVFKYIKEKGFNGVVGMEHGNSRSGEEGEMAVIKAYQEVSSF